MSYEAQAALVHLPGPGITAAIPSGSSSAAIDLSAYVGQRVRVHVTVLSYLRAGTSAVGAAVVTDAAFPANVPEIFYVSDRRAFVRIYGSGAGTLSVSPVDE